MTKANAGTGDSGLSRIEALERLGRLRADGLLTEDEFVRTREARDKTLDMPRLIIPSLQVNMKAGELPAPDASGKRFLKVPLDGL